MKKVSKPTLAQAITILVIGILRGSIFVFGVQYWNESIPRDSCTEIETQFVAYDEIKRLKSPQRIREIAIDCTNGERYFIDGASINAQLREDLRGLQANESIRLLIHPNSSTIVEFTAGDATLLEFDETIKRLGNESVVFLILGVFMYISALFGLYHVAVHIKKSSRKKTRR